MADEAVEKADEAVEKGDEATEKAGVSRARSLAARWTQSSLPPESRRQSSGQVFQLYFTNGREREREERSK